MGLFNKTPEEKAQAIHKAEFLVVRTEAKLWGIRIDKEGNIFAYGETGGGTINGATAAVLSEGEIRDRFTATRILALGIFALAFKKKTSDKDVFIVIEHPDYTLSVHVPSKDESKARAWARRFNTVA